MQSFNKVTCQKLRADLNRVLAAYGATEGIVFSVGNMRFSETEVRITSMSARINGAPKREEKALEHQFAIHGLREVNDRGDRLIEYNRRRYQYPFVFISAANGKRYKCSLAQAKREGFESNTASVR
jgi:hypothetical protein